MAAEPRDDWINISHGPINMSVMAWITYEQKTKSYVVHIGPGAYIALTPEDTPALRDWAQKKKVRLPTELTIVR
jgi:hypothetical protein